jgi:hypothetical protein
MVWVRNLLATFFGTLFLCAAWGECAEALPGLFTVRLQRATHLRPRIRALAADASDPDQMERAAAEAPRSTDLWIYLGLTREHQGRLGDAEVALLHAASIDRSLLPAWTLANFYFRQSRQQEFWHWASFASTRVYDDFRPLLRLCYAFEKDPNSLLSRLAIRDGEMARVLLDFLIGEHDVAGAQALAERMIKRKDPADRSRLLDWVSRELSADRWEAALHVWNALEQPLDPDRGPVLANSEFLDKPSGVGFDSRLLPASGVQSGWTAGGLVFAFSGAQPDEAILLEQVFPVHRGRVYEVASEARPLSWELNGGAGLLRASSDGLATLRLVYRRALGDIPLQGDVHISPHGNARPRS